MTASGLPGMAPATMVFNVGEMDNAIAFRTNGDDGFFVQGFIPMVRAAKKLNTAGPTTIM